MAKSDSKAASLQLNLVALDLLLLDLYMADFMTDYSEITRHNSIGLSTFTTVDRRTGARS